MCSQSLRLWRKWAEAFVVLQNVYTCLNKPKSALWLPTDPESGAVPTVNSSSRSSSPSKVMDEGKVKSAVILNCY